MRPLDSVTIRVWLPVALFAFMVTIACGGQRSQPGERNGSAETFRTELGRGQDPSIIFKAGFYNLVQSSADARSITVRRSRSIKSLFAARRTVVWRGGMAGTPCCELWAPDMEIIDGKWYIYFAADNGNNVNHRMYVIKADRPQGPYSFKARLVTPKDRWAIDGTVLETGNGDLYFLWSGWPGTVNVQQNIYIAPMADPWTVEGPRVVLSEPTYAWEKHGEPDVNEGPAVLIRNNRIYVSYSGSGCWTPNYALGLLEAHSGEDLLDPKSWHKSPTPVFRASDDAGVYGPGHNQFFESPDGTEDWFVYHAVSTPVGDCGRLRTVRAQKISWSGPDGRPIFGTPRPPETEIPLPAGDPGTDT